MHINVDFTPIEVQALASKVCIVIDAGRATSSLNVVMSKKTRRVILRDGAQADAEIGPQDDLTFLLQRDLIDCVPGLIRKDLPEPEYVFPVMV